MTANFFDVILVGYRFEDTVESMQFCEKAFARLASGGRMVLVLNNDVLRSKLVANHPAWEVLIGSNDLAEFSGWQEGLSHLRQSAESGSRGVIFVNDTVTTHRYVSPARTRAIQQSIYGAEGAELVGFRDSAGSEFMIGDLALDDWASTYCFALTNDALDRLSFQLYDIGSVKACVPGGTAEAEFFAGISDALDLHLRNWLFGGGWYGSQPLSAKNKCRFELKAKCIIAEKLLSAACMRRGVRPVDPFGQFAFLRRLDNLISRFRRESHVRTTVLHERSL